MILESVVLENIRSHKKTEIVFPKGTILLEGNIGSGKSSVLMGIEFALFGTGSQKAESLLAKGKRSCNVVLNFESGGKKYEVGRTLTKSGRSITQDSRNSYIKEDGQKDPLSSSDLKQRVLQILGYNEPASPRAGSRIFRYAVFTPQEEMKYVLTDWQKRLETIRRAFGMDEYKIISDNAKNLLSHMKNMGAGTGEKKNDLKKATESADEAKESIARTASELKMAIVAKKKNAAKEKEIAAKYDKMRESSSQMLQLREKISNLEADARRGLEKARGAIRDATDSKKEIGKTVKKIRDIKDLPKPTAMSLSQIESKLVKFRKMHDEISGSRGRLEQLKDELGPSLDAKKLEAARTRLVKLLDSERAKSEDLAGKAKICSDDIIRNKQVRDGLEAEAHTLKGVGASCPVCKKEIDSNLRSSLEADIKSRLDKTKAQLRKDEARLEQMHVVADKSGNAIKEYEEAIKENGEAIADAIRRTTRVCEIKEAQKDLAALESKYVLPGVKGNLLSHLEGAEKALARYAEAQGRLVDYRGELKMHEAALKRAETAQKEGQTEQETTERELVTARKKIVHLEGLADDIKKAKSALDAIRTLTKKDGEVIGGLTADKENHEKRLAEYAGHVRTIKEWLEDRKKYARIAAWLDEFLIPAVSQMEKQVLLSVHTRFSESYGKWYSMLIDDATKESRIDDGFGPLIEQDGYEQDVAFLSGGERTGIALAYRLALNTLMREDADKSGSGLLILDEPTDGFSRAQLGKLHDVLGELGSEQIILVSHARELESHAGCVFEVRKEAGTTEIKRAA